MRKSIRGSTNTKRSLCVNLFVQRMFETRIRRKLPQDENETGSTNVLRFLLFHLFHICLLNILKDRLDLTSVHGHKFQNVFHFLNLFLGGSVNCTTVVMMVLVQILTLVPKYLISCMLLLDRLNLFMV